MIPWVSREMGGGLSLLKSHLHVTEHLSVQSLASAYPLPRMYVCGICLGSNAAMQREHHWHDWLDYPSVHCASLERNPPTLLTCYYGSSLNPTGQYPDIFDGSMEQYTTLALSMTPHPINHSAIPEIHPFLLTLRSYCPLFHIYTSSPKALCFTLSTALHLSGPANILFPKPQILPMKLRLSTKFFNALHPIHFL